MLGVCYAEAGPTAAAAGSLILCGGSVSLSHSLPHSLDPFDLSRPTDWAGRTAACHTNWEIMPNVDKYLKP